MPYLLCKHRQNQHSWCPSVTEGVVSKRFKSKNMKEALHIKFFLWLTEGKKIMTLFSNKLLNEAIYILTRLFLIQEVVLMRRHSGPSLTLSCPQGYAPVVPPWFSRTTVITPTSLPPQSQVTSTFYSTRRRLRRYRL